MSNKISEALKHVAKGEKALSTGLLKWSPDYDIAAEEFSQAALKFQLGKSHEKAISYYLKASDMCLKTGSFFTLLCSVSSDQFCSIYRSAKLLCQAAQVEIELNHLHEGVDLMERAAGMYREQGSPDSAVLTYAKAAKTCEQTSPERSFDMFMKAAELCEVDEKHRDACDYLNGAVRVLLKQKKYLQTCDIIKKRIEVLKLVENWGQTHQAIVGLIITYLSVGDFNAAEESNMEGFSIHGYADSDYAICAEQFLQAFKDGDEEMLNSVKKHTLVKHMEIELAKLAKALTLSNVTSSSVSNELTGGLSELEQFERTEAVKLESNTQVEDEPPDEEGGLC